MTVIHTTEGKVEFKAPNAGKLCKTWYKIFGDLKSGPPLIGLHGGPGAGHEYLTPLVDLQKQHGIPIILYDQVGTGRSTHFREKENDTGFWTFDLYLKELDNLMNHLKLRDTGFFLLGHSWGGMFGSIYASQRPKGLKKWINVSGPASVPLTVKGFKGLFAKLPDEVRKIIEDGLESGDYESPDFKKASEMFYGRHVCRLDPMPKEVQIAFGHLEEDPTAYLTLQGPSEFVITGSFKDWEGYKEGHKIEVPTLLINGQYDEMTDLGFEPWFKTIPKVKWVILENASHMNMWEVRERFIEVVGGFLTSN